MLDLLENTSNGLKDLWSDDQARQNAKVTLIKAFEDMDVPMVTISTFLSNLDEILRDKEEDDTPKRDPAL